MPSSVFQVSFAGGPGKNKEVLSSPTPSISVSQTSDFQYESQLFTEANLAEMEKTFQSEVNSTGGEAESWAPPLASAQGGTQDPAWVDGAGCISIFASRMSFKTFHHMLCKYCKPTRGYLGPREKIPLIQTLRQPLSAFQHVCN